MTIYSPAARLGATRYISATVLPTDLSYLPPHICLNFNNGTKVVTAFGNVAWPTQQTQGNASATNGILTVPAGGNIVANVWQNDVINTMFDCQTLTGTYKCIIIMTKLYRNVIGTAMSTNERLLQIDNQGSSAGQNGGFACRINLGGGGFTAKTLTFTVHTPYVAGESGNQSLQDAQATTTTLMDADAAGTTLALVIDNSVSPWGAKIYVNGALEATDDCPAHPIDGSRNLPYIATTIFSGSGGMSFLSQSDGSTNPLKDSVVYPFWIGRARDTAHAAALAAAHHADPLANPFSRA